MEWIVYQYCIWIPYQLKEYMG